MLSGPCRPQRAHVRVDQYDEGLRAPRGLLHRQTSRAAQQVRVCRLCSPVTATEAGMLLP